MGIGPVDHQQVEPTAIGSEGPSEADGSVAPGHPDGRPNGVAPGVDPTQALPGGEADGYATGAAPNTVDTFVSSEIEPGFGDLMPAPANANHGVSNHGAASHGAANHGAASHGAGEPVEGGVSVAAAQQGDAQVVDDEPGLYDGMDPEFAAEVKARVEAKIQQMVEETEPIVLDGVRVRSWRSRNKQGDDWVTETRYRFMEGPAEGADVEYDPESGILRHQDRYFRTYTNEAGELVAITSQITPQQQVAGMLAGKEGFDGPSMDDLLFEAVIEAQRDGYSPVSAEVTQGDGETSATTTETQVRAANISVSPRVPDSRQPIEDPGAVWGLRVTFGDDGTAKHVLTGESIPYEGGATWSDVFDNVEHFADAIGLGGVYDAVEKFALGVGDIDASSGSWGGIVEAAGDFWDSVTDVWEGAKQFASDVWDATKEFFGGEKSLADRRDEFDNSQDRRDNLAAEGIDPSVRDDPDDTGPGGIL